MVGQETFNMAIISLPVSIQSILVIGIANCQRAKILPICARGSIF